MYRYRILILTVLIATLINALALFCSSLLVKTAILELSLLISFLVLFSKRKDRSEPIKQQRTDNGMKIYL